MGLDAPQAAPARHLRFLISGRDGSSIRPVFLLGFAAVFALWLASGWELDRRIAQADRQAATITQQFTDGEEMLFTVRAQVFLTSVYARDAVLDAAPDAIARYRQQLQTTRAEVERVMQQYLPDVDSIAERERWTRLQAELQDFWASVSPALMGQASSPTAALGFLRRQVIPKRDLIVRVSEDIRTLNQDALQQQQAEVAGLHRALRQRIWWTSGLAALLGLAIAFMAARYAGQLESRIREQHQLERQHKRDLQRLSAELVHVQEDERRKIGRDLHDEVGQALMTIKLGHSAIDRSGQVSGAAAQALAEARSTTDHAIQAVRDLSQLLHPPMLDDFGLTVTLDAYVRGFSQRTGVQTELVGDRLDARLDPTLELCVYRVVQEALTNVAKHAQASSCRVYLQGLAYSLLVTVEDDGQGVASDRAPGPDGRPGVGLVGARERVARLGGTFLFESRPGKGTRLTIEIPVSSVEADVPETPAIALPAREELV